MSLGNAEEEPRTAFGCLIWWWPYPAVLQHADDLVLVDGVRGVLLLQFPPVHGPAQHSLRSEETILTLSTKRNARLNRDTERKA